MDHSLTGCNFVLEHFLDGAIVRREIGLLDRIALHREQRFLDQLPHRAEIATGG